MISPLLKQTWTMSGVLINMFGQGLVLSYPSSLLPALNRPDSPIKVDLHSSSWLGSIVGIAGLPGFLLSSVLMASYGRRRTHALVIIPGVIGWLLIYSAKNVPMLLIGRFLGGLSATATVSLGAIVIGEYTSPKYRGVFLYLKNAVVCIGALVMHIVSRYLHWRTIALMSLIPLVVAQLIIYTWPESPAWLASKQHYGKSKVAFYWLRGDNEASRKELEDIINAQKANLSKSRQRRNCIRKIRDFFRKFTQKDFLKPFLIMILATTVLETSGRHILPAYSLHIMKEITGETSQSFFYTLGLDMIITVSALFASILVKLINRRTLLFFTGFAALLVLASMCLYLIFASQALIDEKPFIPVGLLMLYFILTNLGCAPIPLALVGEVFPLAHREVGSALSGVWISVCLLVALKSTPHMLVSIGVCGFFIVTGSLMGVSLIILYFVMPETKDRTLQEIENYLNTGKFADNSVVDEEVSIKMVNK